MLKLATTAVFVSFGTHASLAPAAHSETAATAAAPTTYAVPAAAGVTKTVVVTKTVKTVPAVQRLPEFETIRAALLSPRPVQKEALYKVVRVEASDVLNVRGGPSADTPRVGTLDPSATHVRVTGLCEGRWCPVAREQLTGWVNRGYLETEDAPPAQPAAAHVHTAAVTQEAPKIAKAPPKDPRDAPRSCLTKPARALLETIEAKFGRVQLVSTCRPGATIAGSGRPSRHASGNAVDFKAGGNKAAIVTWLIANHKSGGTMTYADMDHIHVDIGPHFVSLAGRRMQTARASSPSRDWSSSRMSLRGRS